MTRGEAIKIIKECKEKGFKHTFYTLNEYYTALDMAIKALEQEPCPNAISRSDMLDAVGHGMKYTSEELQKIIKGLPPVNPQPKTGHWIEQIDYEENCRTLICSNCDRPALHDEDSIWKHKFCPHCGAKMIEPQEREG